ncbi:MAG: hypothetical protein Q4E63_07915 [Prevotellaceae bacterium]|nr:hypothetical protein [Prevotellaceae bacterium]MDO4932552.1 hypothetical protein [Prevotellaceae bacterium]
MKQILVAIVAMLASFTSGMAQTKAVYARSSVRCLGVELDGSQTLRVQGYGRNRADAKEQAKKNAVWAVIFDGIRDGAEGCNTRPLVTEVNARERYEDYFNIFFADNGEYTKYVSMRDTKKRSGGKVKDKTGYAYDLTVRVLRAELKARLKADNVIE